MDDREDGGVGADSQRQRQDADQGECGILEERTEGVPQVRTHASSFRDHAEGPCRLAAYSRLGVLERGKKALSRPRFADRAERPRRLLTDILAGVAQGVNQAV